MIPLVFALATLIGGSNAPIVKFAVSEIPAIIFVALRAAIALVIITPFVLKKLRPLPIKNYFPLVLVNLLFAVNWLTFAIGVQQTSVIMSQLIYVPTSLIVGVLSFFILGRKLAKNQLWGLSLTITGALILILGYQSGQNLTFGTPFGNFLIIIGMLSWSLYLVLSDRFSKIYSPLVIIFSNFAVSALFASALVSQDQMSMNFNFATLNKNGFVSLLYVGVFSSAIYFYLNQWLVKHTSAFISSLQLYPVTLIAGILGVIFYGEKPTLSIIIATLLIISGVFLSTSYQYLKKRNYAKN